MGFIISHKFQEILWNIYISLAPSNVIYFSPESSTWKLSIMKIDLICHLIIEYHNAWC